MERTLQNPTHHTPTFQRTYRKRGSRGRRRKKKKTGQLNTGIFNLSGVDLSEEELLVLSQGLKFAPSKNIDKFDVFVDIEKFIRKLNIKKHFSLQANISSPPNGIETTYLHSGLKNNSVFNPKKSTHHHIEVFKNMVQEEVRSLKVPKFSANQSIRVGIKKIRR